MNTTRDLPAIASGKGAYIVWLEPCAQAEVVIGKLGKMRLQPGYYAYVGSAMGPGGVRARLGHHLRIAARPRWHIDYLRAACHVRRLWYTITDERVEHRWVIALSSMPGATVAMPRFGATDHPGATHLYRFDSIPSAGLFAGAVKSVSRMAGACPKIIVVENHDNRQ